MGFLHRAEVMESYQRPPKPQSEEEEWLAKQAKLNENELTYFRNKKS